MKGDFTRVIFDPAKRYAGVLHQQGRVWLDSDWNEEVLEQLDLLRTAMSDVIGRCGVPNDAAFRIVAPATGAAPDDFTIIAGHAYVDGILCRLDKTTSYLRQPDLLDPPRITMPAPGQELIGVVYIEAWDRLITWLQDEELRDVALNGPDTTVRLKTVVQIRVATATAGVTCDVATRFLPPSGGGTLTTLQPVDAPPADLCRLPDPTNFTGRQNRFYRVEVHDAGDVLGGAQSGAFRIRLGQNAAQGATSLTLQRALTTDEANALLRTQAVVLSDIDGRTERVGVASSSGTTISLLRGLGGAFQTARTAEVIGGVARFKWSGDNASFAVRVTAISGDRLTLTLDTIGRDQATALRAGDPVEITDDATDLGPARGHLTYLTKDPDPDQFTVPIADPLPLGFNTPFTPTSPPSSPPMPAAPERHIVLRRWDGQGLAQSVFDQTNTPDMNLGDGVRIQFGGSGLQPGDYWNFTARAADGSVEALADAAPNGILRFRCPIAIVRWRNVVTSPPSSPPGSPPSSPPGSPPVSNIQFDVVNDCRCVFPRLCGPAIRVTGVEVLDGCNRRQTLNNDMQLPVAQFLGGIDVTVSGQIANPVLRRPVCQVTVQIPSTLSSAPPGEIPLAGYEELVLDGEAAVNNGVISWRMRNPFFLGRMPFQALLPTDRGILTRLVLKGNFIHGPKAVAYLDGEAFGTQGRDGIDLRLPSGDGYRGGNFETWFWLTTRTPTITTPFILTALATPPLVRGEGQAELVSQIVLNGTGGNPTPLGATVQRANISVFLNTAITSRRSGADLSDAVLLIDEPTTLNTSEFGVTNRLPLLGTGEGLDFRDGCAPNVYRGQFVAGAAPTLVFTGVPMEPPGTGVRVFRIVNLRSDVSALAIGGVGIPAQVQAVLSIAGAAIPITNPTLAVAFVQPGTVVRMRSRDDQPASAFTFNRSADLNGGMITNPAAIRPPLTFQMRFTEGFAASFRPLSGEAGFRHPNLAGIGDANTGTRFRLLFENVPAGVALFVTTRDVSPTGPGSQPRAVLVPSDASGASGTAPQNTPPGVTTSDGYPIVGLPITNGSGSAVWEWIAASDPTRIEDLNFGVVVAARANEMGSTTATVRGNLAPVVIPTQGSTAIPRFVATGQPITVFSFTQIIG